MCNCKVTEIVLSIVILVFAIWPSQIVSAVASKWIIIIAAVILLLHGLACKNIRTCTPVKTTKPVRRAKKARAKAKRRRRR